MARGAAGAAPRGVRREDMKASFSGDDTGGETVTTDTHEQASTETVTTATIEMEATP